MNNKANKTSFKKGHKKVGGFVEGSKHTKKSKELVRQSVLGKKDEQARNWQGGISPQNKRRNAPRIMPDRCEVCGNLGKDFQKGLHYDHNHKTGKFRGWICFKCNVALGMVGDNVEILKKLINYLENNG